jgi:hypothetical protein
MTIRMAFIGAATALMLAGCYPGTVEPALTLSPGFGEAVNYNMAAQIINPAPNYAGLEPERNGRRAADAYARYELDQVFPPAPPLTGAAIFRPPPPQFTQQAPAAPPAAPMAR